jgi:FlaA1/EpsC-like NDP-sugar epimerase
MKEDALPSPTRQTATQSLVTLPRTAKRLLVVALDVCLCMITAWLSICLRFEAWVLLDDYQWLAVGASPVLAVPLLAAFGLYSSVFRFAGRESLRALVGTIALYAALYARLFTVIGFPLSRAPSACCNRPCCCCVWGLRASSRVNCSARRLHQRARRPPACRYSSTARAIPGASWPNRSPGPACAWWAF